MTVFAHRQQEPEVCSLFDFSVDSSYRNLISVSSCSNDVLQVSRSTPDLSLTVTLLEKAGLEEIFQCSGPFTALLPTNDAWAALDPALFEFLLRPNSVELLEDILLYHILPGRYFSADLTFGAKGTLLDGASISVGSAPFRVNEVDVVFRDAVACNGVVHLIAGVLMPFTLGTCAPYRLSLTNILLH